VRYTGKVLILLAIALVLINAGCFARCVVQSCQDAPPPCHSHSKGDAKHCPQQNQMKAAATGAVTFYWGATFMPVDWPAEQSQPEQLRRSSDSFIESSWTPPTPFSFRI
jgi:hypothetical protein